MAAEIFVVETKRGHLLRFDVEGLELFRSTCWVTQATSTRSGKVYRYLARKSDRQLFHRILMQAPQGMVVDHRDGDGLNNMRDNLRVCTHAENMRNRRPTAGRLLPQGVGFKSGSFYAQIRAGEVRRAKHGFSTADEARQVYLQWARELHGEFAAPAPQHQAA